MDDYEYHVCINDDFSWPHLSRKEWHTCRSDKCPVCGEPRFEFRRTLKGGKLWPRKVRQRQALHRLF